MIEKFILPVADLTGANIKRGVCWSEDGKFGLVWILVGYCPDTLPYFAALGKMLQSEVPETKLEDMTCGKVTKSRYVNGFTIITATIQGPRRPIEGYTSWDSIEFNW